LPLSPHKNSLMQPSDPTSASCTLKREAVEKIVIVYVSVNIAVDDRRASMPDGGSIAI